MHKFDPEKLKKLDDPERLNLFDPEKVLKTFSLKPGMVVLDVGTGAGFYLPYISKLVQDQGKVYAIDISQEAVDYAKNKVKELGLKNVEVLKSEENYIPLPDNTVDFVYMAFVFHELEDPVRFLKELERVSKPMGYLALIDWKKEERDKGPPPEEVYSEWEVGMILEEAGLRVGRVVEIGKYAYGFYAVFLKQNLL
ncbi:class I SAM-dependent methyltransferase [Thermocrinis jamiesonii]|jgi:Methylase involved in ubiquinone/menaquinone biosynthesis|uniref:class I SAM-dependent methyltransferase n=1 Tax=Thermocrinis jamiesonii TaxID=1302351 RepID=UPI000495B0DD|nr:methyltransferase domain-containing protein [Thermocrinis jamiesonii]